VSYITQTIVEERMTSAEMIRLTDDAAAGSVDAENLARAIAEGESEILQYVRQRYELPTTLTGSDATSVAVRAHLLDAIVYRLNARRPPIPEDVVLAYQAAIRWAEQVAKGAIGLTDWTEVDESPAAVGRFTTDSVERVISRESTAGL